MLQHIDVPATSQEAKEKGLKFFFTGKLCKKGHLSVRDTTHDNKCLACIQEANRKAQAKYVRTPRGRAKQCQHTQAYYARNAEECRLKGRVKYYQQRLDTALDELLTLQATSK